MNRYSVRCCLSGPVVVLAIRNQYGEETTVDPFGIVRGRLRNDLKELVRKNPLAAYEVIAKRAGCYRRQGDEMWKRLVLEAWRRYDPSL